MNFKSKTKNLQFLFPQIDSSRDNNTFACLRNSKEFERYFEVLISLYPLTDGLMLHLTRNLKEEIDKLWRNNGAKYTVTYLKEANRLFQFFVAGNPQKSSLPCMIGAPKGLPSLLSPGHRDLLINNVGHRDYANVVRIIFALLGCYRLIVYPGELKLETITDKSDSIGINPYELGFTVSTKFDPLFKRTSFKQLDFPLLSLTTTGPNNRISLLSAPLDAIALRGSDILKDLQVISDYFKTGIYQILEQELKYLETFKASGSELLSKLSIKEEPAGKRRVFAIVDIWTQSVLKPMHDHVFSILKLISQDGAFDQIRPVKALIKNNKDLKTFCYDLSAATDRFPISVQVDVLSHLYNRTVAESWKQLLVNRDYYLNETKQSYRYGAGQPMGALSSWGVFSLCHHVIVQIAATRVGIRTWFSEYALLGDDIVITNELVANEYYNIMTNELKVSINKTKSLQSNTGVMEFAKRIIGPKGDFSPVGPKNLALVLVNKLNLPSLLVDLKEKGIGIDYFFINKLFIKWKKKNLFKFTWVETHAFTWSLCKPFGFLDTYTVSPLKWVKKLSSKDEVVGNLQKLLGFMKEEWSKEHDKAVASVLVAINKLDGFVNIDNIFVHTSNLPSIKEQKAKLFCQLQRLIQLPYPTLDIVYNKAKPQSRWLSFAGFGDSLYAPMEYSQPILVDTVDLVVINDDGTKVILRTFNVDSKPEYTISQVLHYLFEVLPPISPTIMPVSVLDNQVINRSLRHVSLQFLNKFLKWEPDSKETL